YWDAQGRLEWFPTDRDRVVWTGIGALDEFDLVAPDAGDIENQEIFDRVLDNDQKSYTVGGVWERQVGQGVLRLAASRSWTDYRFRDLDGAGVELLRNRSTEVRMPFRLEGESRVSSTTELEWGVVAERVGLDLDLFQEATPGSAFDEPVRTDGAIRSWRSGAYLQAVKRLADERLSLTAGMRVDHDDALETGGSVSPRIGLSFAASPVVTFSAATGWFHQSPALLSVAVEEDGAPVNRDLLPIRNVQGLLGVAWRPAEALRLKVEGFWKDYSRYPVLRDDPRISLANLGGDYGFIGGEPLEPVGEGRARGVEFFVQRKLTDAVWLLGAYTLSSSEFSGSDGELAPSSWDVRHALDLTAGWRPSRRWEFGTKLRVLSGRPFTPFDEDRSAAEYALTGRGVPDWDRIAAERTGAYARLDIRAERVFDFGGWNGRLFLDVQNLLNRPNEIGYTYTEDPAFPDRRRPIDGTGLLPFFGFSVEF
ncbi:MAG: TonB-dependent receptor, partial [Gemmatimonadetes bacterium]|nr:TonB-dependent receptor [Gemmatimonadota bacterium]